MNELDAFVVTPEQRELRAVVRAFAVTSSPEPVVRRLQDDPLGYDPVVWRRLTGELGLVGLGVPEAYGGVGAGFAEVAVVAEELGRVLYGGPYLSTMSAVRALLASGDDAACVDLVPSLCDGVRTATFALDGGVDTPRLDPDGLVAGRSPRVLDGASADVLLVVADSDDGPTLVAVDRTAPGVHCTPLRAIDGTRRLADVRLDAVPARRIGSPGDGGRVLEHVADLAAIAVAAEQAGVAARALEIAVDYAKTRVQGGGPIGAYQAVKHRCAELLVLVESSLTAARYAAWTVDASPGEMPAAASMARAYCSDACTEVTESALHLHGGIGFTWEHSAQLFYKRAKLTELLLGTPREHRARLADRLEFSALR